MQQLTARVAERLDRLNDIHIQEIGDAFEQALGAIHWLVVAGSVTITLSLAGGVGLVLWFSGWVGRSVRALAEASRAMAEGDLSRRVPVVAGGELGDVSRAFNEMGERMAALRQALADRVRELEAALAQVKTLRGLVPLCAWCSRRIREAGGGWTDLATYIRGHSEAEVTHAICPECKAQARKNNHVME